MAPPTTVAEPWGIPEEGVTLNSAGRLRIVEGDKSELDTSKVRDMDGARVILHGMTSSPCKWRAKRRQIVAKFTPEQIGTIIG